MIVSIDKDPETAGLVMNEHAIQKKYKVGKQIATVVLDVDPTKMIIDLSERLENCAQPTV